MGEHSNGFENQYETSFRAIVEEIFGGQNILNMIPPSSSTTRNDDKYDGTYSLEEKNGGGHEKNTDPRHVVGQGNINGGYDDNPNVDPRKLLNVTIEQLSDRPFYYLRDYGEELVMNDNNSSNDSDNDNDNDNNNDHQKKKTRRKMKQPRNRIDRQITWLMKAQFFGNNNNNNEGDDDGSRHDDDTDSLTKLLQFDDEVSDHIWVTLEEYERMLYGNKVEEVEGRRRSTNKNDRHDDKNNSNNDDDDDDDEIDPSIIREFCHPTIVKLARLGLDLLKERI